MICAPQLYPPQEILAGRTSLMSHYDEKEKHNTILFIIVEKKRDADE